jgi:RNAse (barnase) inhibitor barstar
MGTGITGAFDQCPSGVYLIDAEERGRVLRDEAFPREFAIAILNGDHASTRAGFFREIARALRFPDYFGHNWDAVYDCLTDLNWLPAAGYVLIFDGFERLANDDPGQWKTGLTVLRDACAFWAPLRTPMYALLHGPLELASDVPPLPSGCLPFQYDASEP